MMELDEQLDANFESTGLESTVEEPKVEESKSGTQKSDSPFLVELEAIISRFETTVFSLAMNLTNELSSSAHVVEQVFLRLSREKSISSEEELETLIHRFTYDAAINELIASKLAPIQ